MYEILIVSHGALAQGYHKTMKMILGDEPEFTYCSLEDGESSEELEIKIKNSVNWKSDAELLILVDIYSGSPCRSAITQLLSSRKKSYIIAGISLPLVMEAYSQRYRELADTIDTLVSIARENVINVNEQLKKNKCNTEDE